MAAGREVSLLDVGCGPATLERLLAPNIRYYGIDIAIQEPAPNLKQSDILQEPISSDAAPFDLIVAEGLFEYLADQQSRKFAEIADLLTPSGQIHRHLRELRSPSAELLLALQQHPVVGGFRAALAEHFVVERQLPTAHNWNHSEPGRWYVRGSNMYVNVRIPFFTRWLGVEYLYVCRPRIRGN